MTSYTIYVPNAGAVHDIRPGSAIVGETAEGYVSTHYEGGGASNVQTFEEKITHAAGRRKERYPTSAMRGWPENELHVVGHVAWDESLQAWIVTSIDDENALRQWIGESDDVAVGGGTKHLQECAGRLFGRLSPVGQQRIIAMRLPPEALTREILKEIKTEEV